jgi:hypothetical protein
MFRFQYCKCGSPIEASRLGQGYCKACHAAYMRLNRPKYAELTPEQKMKKNARSYLHSHIKRGLIKKRPCCICGEARSESHHPDYSKPLEVIWFCRDHHLQFHQGLVSIPA